MRNRPSPSRGLLFGAILLLGWVWARAAGPDRLDAFLEGLSTLQADFEQQVLVGDGGSQPYQGVFYLQRPGRFRWEYRVPEQLVVGDGETIWLFDPELEQVSFKRQGDAFGGTPAQLLVGADPPEKHFLVEDRGESAGLEWVALSPREAQSEFELILLGFEGEELRVLEMRDSFGQVTRFRFSAMLRNPELEPRLFDFRPPPGMDVIGD